MNYPNAGSRTVMDSRTRRKPRRSYVARAAAFAIRHGEVEPAETARDEIGHAASQQQAPQPGVGGLRAAEHVHDPGSCPWPVDEDAGGDHRAEGSLPVDGSHDRALGEEAAVGAVQQRRDVLRDPRLRGSGGLVVGVVRWIGGLGGVQVVLGHQAGWRDGQSRLRCERRPRGIRRVGDQVAGHPVGVPDRGGASSQQQASELGRSRERPSRERVLRHRCHVLEGDVRGRFGEVGCIQPVPGRTDVGQHHAAVLVGELLARALRHGPSSTPSFEYSWTRPAVSKPSRT